ncbi:MAG TPA: hypothetical protein GXX71_00765 [Acholeplasma sp.]|jgi:replication initiation and membrane attachment protein|nr:hypothetical protein [Acholeplasma sp.]
MTNKSFWVMTSSFCSSEDIKTLSLLYQPLIGPNSLGCYLMLSNLVNPTNLQTDIYKMQYLLDILNFNVETLTNVLDKLNAIGLLTTYEKDNIYLFRLNMPLKPRQFFLDTILGPYLKSEVGDKNFDQLFSYFSSSEVSKKGYKNITKAFDQVYKTKVYEPISSEKFIIGRKNNGGVIIKDAFDFETFYEGLPIRLKKRRIFTKKVISQIASVMYVYNFTEREMIRILSSAYDEENNKIFAEKIGLLAREYFEKNYTESQITFEKQPEVADEVDLRTLKPQDIIAVIGGKMTNNSVALETIRKFIERNAVDIGLINGVIIASIKYTGHVPSLVYLEKVLADWLSKGIKTGKDALRVLQGIPETPKSKTRKRVSDDEPEWLDGIIASFDEEEE